MSYSHFHTPVLLKEILQAFESVAIKTFVDCTLGAGGHSEGFLKAHPEIECLIGIDQDPTARAIASERLKPWENKVKIVAGNFKDFSNYLDQLKVSKVDGILMDLGVSSMQLDQPEKGFSFTKNGPLDMRMNPENPLTAAEIVNTWTEKEIGRILRDYGEEKHWKMATRAIVSARVHKPILTTQELAAVLMPVLRWKAKKTLNPLTLIFQGLRIFVNRELEVLEEALPETLPRLNPKGKLAVISFHSLEDRIVKQFFQREASDKENTSGLSGLFLDKEPTIAIVNKKPLMAEEKEVKDNPRSRSAKLRIVEKL